MNIHFNVRWLTAVLAVVVIAGAVSANDKYESLHGTWKCDVAKTKKLLQTAGLDEQAIDDMLNEVSTFMVTVGKDGSLKIKADDMSLNGTWKGIEYDEMEKTGAYSFTGDDGEEMKIKFKVVGKDTLHMAPEGQELIVFVREQAEKKKDKVDDNTNPQVRLGVADSFVVLTQEDEEANKKAGVAKLVGKWKGDRELCEKLLDDIEDLNADGKEMMLGMVEGISVEFTKDMKFNVDIKTELGDNKVFGTWSVKSYDKDKNTLKIETVADEESEGEDKTFEIEITKDGKAIFRSDDDPPMGFKRVTSDKKDAGK